MNRKNSELKDMARAFLLGNYTAPIAALAVTGAITFTISSIFQYVAGVDSATFFAVNILLAVVEYVLNAGLCMMHLDIARRRRTRWQRVFEPFKHANRFVVLSAVYLMVTTLPFLPALLIESMRMLAIGFTEPNASAEVSVDWLSDTSGMVILLLVLGGVACIYFMLSFFLAFYIMIDNPALSAGACLTRSFTLMKGNKIRLLLLNLSFAGWFVLAILSFGIGLFWLVPYYNQSMTNFYLDLIREFDIQVSFSPEGMAEAGKYMSNLKDTVVVEIEKADGVKVEAHVTGEKTDKTGESETNGSGDNIERPGEGKDDDSESDHDDRYGNSDMAALDDRYFDE